MLYCTETNVIGSQTSDVAVGGDVVNFTCHVCFHGEHAPSLWWSPAGERIDGNTIVNDTIGWEESTTSVQVPDGPANVSHTCCVNDFDASWSSVYFWQSILITVSCQYV